MGLKDIKEIELESIDDVSLLKKLVEMLIDYIETNMHDIEKLKRENQELKDELNRLKGEQAKPKFKKQKTDISSKGREHGEEERTAEGDVKSKNHKQGGRGIEIDREEVLDINASELPLDAILIDKKERVVQNIVFKRENVKYRILVYYSESTGKTYEMEMPNNAANEPKYGTTLLAFITTLNSLADVSQGNLLKLLHSIGIIISAGTLNKLIHSNANWALAEQQDILRAGIENGEYAQIDATPNKQAGKKLTTQIITGKWFCVYVSLLSKGRVDVLRAIQGNMGELKVSYNEQTAKYLEFYKVSSSDRSNLKKCFKLGDIFTLEEFNSIVEKELPKLFGKDNIYPRVVASFGLGYYHTQTEFPIIRNLISDAAPEYLHIPTENHAYCWVHDARHYNKLNPVCKTNIKALESFKKQYWAFYNTLLAYKKMSSNEQQANKSKIYKAFDKLFSKVTPYSDLNALIRGTAQDKEKLLVVLEFPSIPLHNNDAELGARRIVRNRDSLLHTMSGIGTKVRDAVLSIVQTCTKNGIPPIQYIIDRLEGKDSPSLASMIRDH